jgi:PPOX class probable F420-dependent enzyme
MSPDEVTTFLASSRKMQLATINRDGTPHLVTMFYTLLDGQIAFWTYYSSQKARNLTRDPRATCLVEDGENYFELRGVQIQGVTKRIVEPAKILAIGRQIAPEMSGVPAEVVAEYVAHTARKRWAYVLEPERIISWDHHKLRLP